METIAEWNLSVYPNPAHDQVQIELPPEGNWMLLVTDMFGNRVWQQSGNGKEILVMPTGLWPAGMYLLTAEHNGRLQTMKIQVVH